MAYRVEGKAFNLNASEHIQRKSLLHASLDELGGGAASPVDAHISGAGRAL
jgi:hypothetical protein